MTLRIGWIGTGVMGRSQAMHLLEKGWPLTVYTRTMSKAKDLADRGARTAASPAEVAENSDVVFSMVGHPCDVREVAAGEKGVFSALRKGGVYCDMTTSSPALACELAELAAEKGIISMDAPVTGGDVGARNATLSIFAGGPEEGMAVIRPMLEAMGSRIMHCGGAGSGQKAKLANQVAVAGVMFSVCESLLFAQKAGLDVRSWHALVAPGAAGSVAMQTLGTRIMDGNFEPGFFIEHFVKDLGLVLDECRRMHLVLPGAALAQQFYSAMQAQGEEKKGTQNLVNALARFSGTEWIPCPERK